MSLSLKSSRSVLQGGRVDISQIQNEVSHAISNDLKNHREDEMKKRAIRTCKDYNEFEAFVSCSELKPVSSFDMDQLFTTRKGGTSRRKENDNQKQILNRGCKKFDSILLSAMKPTRYNDSSSSMYDVKCPYSSPKNIIELEKEWSIYCKDPESTLRYMLLSTEDLPNKHFEQSMDDIRIPTSPRLSHHDFKQLCRNEITPSILVGVIDALECFIKLNSSGRPAHFAVDFIVNWVESITECGRFELSLNFLDGKEKIKLHSIVSFLRHCEKCDQRVTRVLKLLE